MNFRDRDELVEHRLAAAIGRVLDRAQAEHGLLTEALVGACLRAGINRCLQDRGFPASAAFVANRAEAILLETLVEGVGTSGKPN